MVNVEKIKELFLSTGMKEDAYVQQVGMSQSNFSNCLHCKRKFSRKILSRIAEIHKLAVDDLLISETSDLETKLNIWRKYKLTETEVASIKKISMHLELLDLVHDKVIRDAYQHLFEFITYKEYGVINMNVI